MKQFLLQMVSRKGDVSSLRIMSLMSVLSATALAVIGIFRGSDLSALAILCGTFLSAGFAGKVLQKKTEETATKED